VTHNRAEAKSAGREHQFSVQVIDLELSDGLGVNLALSLIEEGQSADSILHWARDWK
jgi:hypothetical protein